MTDSSSQQLRRDLPGSTAPVESRVNRCRIGYDLTTDGTFRPHSALFRVRTKGHAVRKADDNWSPTPNWFCRVSGATTLRGRRLSAVIRAASTTYATALRAIRQTPRI